MNSVTAQPGGRRMLPWILVALLVVALGFALYKQLDMAVSLDHMTRQAESVTTQRDTLKLLVESHASSFTRETVTRALAGHPEQVSFSKGKDLLVVDQLGLRFEGERLKGVELE